MLIYGSELTGYIYPAGCYADLDNGTVYFNDIVDPVNTSPEDYYSGVCREGNWLSYTS